MTGWAELITSSDTEYLHALDAYDWEHCYEALGCPTDKVTMERTIIKVTPSKIEFRHLGLLNRGYAVRQIWEAEKTWYGSAASILNPLGKRHPA